MNWLGKFPDPFLAEIAGQAEAIRRAAGSLEEQVPTLEALGEAAARGGGVVFTGMGSSYDACYPAVNELAARGVSDRLRARARERRDAERRAALHR